jgi:hypothetical protein
MTYLAGIVGFGSDRESRIACDGPECTRFFLVLSPPPAWFLAGRAPSGWSVRQDVGGDRVDLCSACRKAGSR